jgi:hypothetical protein
MLLLGATQVEIGACAILIGASDRVCVMPQQVEIGALILATSAFKHSTRFQIVFFSACRIFTPDIMRV